ncbi:hypothetical protein MNV49_000349 [Pseudohyphozyma bogoriensis]|nr:hypothetical protein MNV49_000349 [Pseudohyphozyma bogoriensis]
MAQPTPTTYVFKRVGDLEIAADVFLPSGTPSAPLPILLWFHGGGLLMSARSTIGPHLRRAADKYQIAVVSADYRLAPQASITDIMEDVRDADKWTRTELPKLLGAGVVDPENVIVGGHSAGGYLALLAGSPKIGIKPPKAFVCLYPITDPTGPFFTTPQRPVAGFGARVIPHEEMNHHVDPDAPVLSWSLPPCFPPPHGDRGEVYLYMVQEAILEKLLFGKAPDADVRDYIPAKYWTKDLPPVYILHGHVDNRVGIEQSLTLVKALKNAEAPYQFDEIPLPGAQHLFDHFDATEELESMYGILPLTARGIEHGGGVYGAGIYSKANLSLLATGTNMWNKSPLIHACPMCLSAITWSGFNNIFIFFPYSYSESHFDEPYSRLMTEAIWKIRAEGESEEEWKRRELYARKNRFWEARYVEEMVSGLEEGEEKRKFVRRVEGIKREYGKLWKRYEEIPRPPGSGRPDE